MSSAPPTAPRPVGGTPLAIGAYVIWGLLPLYMHRLAMIPPAQFVGWRALFTLPVCILLLLATRQAWKLAAVLRQPRTLALLVLSALLIGANWLIYVIAVGSGHVIGASIGYYINPLLNVLLGTVFLKEKLNARQWLAVGIAGIGVAILGWGARETLGISLALAGTFGFYGLVRKLAPVDSLPGLTVETLVLLVPAAFVVWPQGGGVPSAFAHGTTTSVLVMLAGVVTATPLLMFAAAARRMDLAALGFIQFAAPTLQFLLGLLVFHEPLNVVQLASLCLIWLALGVFSADLWLRTRADRQSGDPR